MFTPESGGGDQQPADHGDPDLGQWQDEGQGGGDGDTKLHKSIVEVRRLDIMVYFS